MHWCLLITAVVGLVGRLLLLLMLLLLSLLMMVMVLLLGMRTLQAVLQRVKSVRVPVHEVDLAIPVR